MRSWRQLNAGSVCSLRTLWYLQLETQLWAGISFPCSFTWNFLRRWLALASKLSLLFVMGIVTTATCFTSSVRILGDDVQAVPTKDEGNEQAPSHKHPRLGALEWWLEFNVPQLWRLLGKRRWLCPSTEPQRGIPPTDHKAGSLIGGNSRLFLTLLLKAGL